MSLTRCLLPMLVLVVTTSLAPNANGQVCDPQLPDLCDLEFNWFKPIYCDCIDELEPNSGFFFTYDRMNLYGSRPDGDAQLLSLPSFNQFGDPEVLGLMTAQVTQTNGLDGSWGNRFNLGYLSNERYNGWTLSVFNLNDPSVLQFEDNVDRNETILVDELGGDVGPTSVTLNSYEMYGIELNKAWRLEPTHRGVLLEPILGLRYVRLTDYSDRSDAFVEDAVFPTVFVPNAAITEFDSTRILQLNSTTDNDLFGGQAGIRTAWRKGRWHLSTDVRGFTFKNLRDRQLVRTLEGAIQPQTATYDDNGVIASITTGTAEPLSQERSTLSADSHEFVYGGELRIIGMFYASEKFAVRAGFDMMAFSEGLGRGAGDQLQNMLLVGYNLGFSINR